jgi:hypothetical protein
MKPFIAMGSSSSSSGEMVFPDCIKLVLCDDTWASVLTIGFFLGFWFEDLRRPLTVIVGADGVVASVKGSAASSWSLSSDATSACD